MRKNTLPLILRILACLILAASAYGLAKVMMDSLMAFRSPLSPTPPQPAAPLAEPSSRKVVVVIVDALRVDTAVDAQLMPALASLRSLGASTTMLSRTPSYSQPGFATLLTGAWPEINDSMVFNAYYEDVPVYTQDNIFSAAVRAGLKTAVSGYHWFERVLPKPAVSASYYTAFENHAADRAVVDATSPWLSDPEYQLILIHLDQVDYAGHHQGGPQNPAWNAAASRADSLLGEIAARLDFNLDTLFIVSDHGQIDRGGHGGHDPITLREPFVLVGHGVIPGEYGDIPMTAVAPTVSALLGANLPASAQSAPLIEMLDLPASTLAAIQAAYPLQQAALAEAYSRAIGVTLDPDLVASGDYQAAMETARINRLQRERLPRFIIAGAIILVPLFFVPWKKWREWIWLLAGAVIYLILFILRYSLFDQLPYSFSTFNSQTWVITYNLSTSAACLLIAAVFLGWREHWLRKTPSQAARRVMDLYLMILVLLSLPVLANYMMNGLVTRWMLPDLRWLYLAILSLIQILLISGLSLIYAGISAAGIRMLFAKSKSKKEKR